jgi:glutathione S-transferase
MKIVGSLTSPFTRAVRVVCEELRLPYDLEVTPPFTKLTDDQERFINLHNPLMKVPILIDGATEVIDSRMIIRHLLDKSPKSADFRGPESVADENILSVVYGVVDAGILRFMLKASHPEINANSGYLSRSLERIKHGLEWLGSQPNLGKTFGATEAMLISGLDWFRKREIYKWEEIQEVSKIHAAFCGGGSLVKTQIPENM